MHAVTKSFNFKLTTDAPTFNLSSLPTIQLLACKLQFKTELIWMIGDFIKVQV